MVIYALVSDTSVGYLFLGGVIPGLLLGVAQMALIALIARRQEFPGRESRAAARACPRITWEAFPALMMPVILLGCLYSGITTPTEAAALAALYALLVSAFLYRAVTWRDIYDSLLTSARDHDIDRHPDRRRDGLQLRHHGREHSQDARRHAAGRTSSRRSPSCCSRTCILLVLGCFLEGTTILLVIVPVLLPTAQALGIDPVHFGVVAVVNIMIGLVTPPYGLLLFMMVKIAEVPLRDLVREVMPFLGVMIGALALITFVPDLVLFLPRLMGYKG